MPQSIQLDPSLKLPPTDPDQRLNRVEAAAALSAVGFRIAPSTLAAAVSRGRSPSFAVFNGIALYRWGDLLEWAETRSVYRGGETVATSPETR
jgi:hypothetical protein